MQHTSFVALVWLGQRLGGPNQWCRWWWVMGQRVEVRSEVVVVEVVAANGGRRRR